MKSFFFVGFTGLFLLLSLPDAHAGKVGFALSTKPRNCGFALTDTKGKVIASGSTPFMGKIPSGRYRLIVRCPGHLEEARVVDADKTRVLHVAPFPVPAGRGKPPAKRKTSAAGVTTRTQPATRRSVATPPVRRVTKKPIQGAATNTKKPFTRKVKREIPWIPVVAAGGLLLTGGVFFVLSQNSFSTANDKNNFQLNAYREYLSGRDHLSTAFFLLVAGSVAAVISGVMYIWGWPSKRKGRKFYDMPRASQPTLFPVAGLRPVVETDFRGQEKPRP